MANVMTADSKSLEKPDERRTFPKGHLDVVNVGGTSMGRATFEPGWKWSECVKPIAGTESCQAPHLGFVISGRLTAVTDDGQRFEYGPNDAMSLPPGHDAWVEGNEPCVIVDFVGYENYAKPK